MPLTVCLDCSREVSPKARFCVHCGRPWPSRKCGKLRKAAIALAVAGLAFGGYAVVKYPAKIMHLQKSILNEVQELRSKVASKPSKAENLPPAPENK